MSRKTRRWSVALALLAALFIALHTPFVKAVAGRLLARAVSRFAGAPFEIGRLDYKLWRGELALDDARLSGEGLDFEAPRIQVSVSPLGRIRARLHQPRFHIRSVRSGREPPGSTSSTAPQAVRLPAVPAVLDGLELSQAAVLVETDAVTVELHPFELSLSKRGDTMSGTLKGRTGHVKLTDREIPLDAIEASLEFSRDGLTIAPLDVRTGPSRFSGRFDLSQIRPLTGRGELDFRMDTSLASIEDLSGHVSGRANVTLEEANTAVTATVESNDLRWARVGPWITNAEVNWKGDTIRVSRFEARGFDGTVAGTGRVDLSGSTTFAVRFEQLSVAPLVERVTGRSIPFTTHTTGTAAFELTRWNWTRAEGTTQLGFEGDVRGTAEISLKKGHLKGTYAVVLEDVRRAPFLAPRAQGSIAFDGTLAGTWEDLAWRSSVASENLVLIGQPAFPLSATLHGDRARIHVEALTLGPPGNQLTAHGSIPMDDRLDWDLEARLEGFRLASPTAAEVSGLVRVSGKGLDPDLEGRLAVRPGEDYALGEIQLDARKKGRNVLLSPVTTTLASGSVEGELRYDLDAETIEATFRGQNARIAELPFARTRLPSLAGELDFKIDFAGRPTHPGGTASIDARSLSLRGSPLPDLRVEARSDGREVHTEVVIAAERSLARAAASLTPPYPITSEVHLDAIPFDGIFAAFPELQSAEPALEASGRVELFLEAASPRSLRYVARIERLLGTYLGIAGGAGAPFLVEGDLESFRVTDLELVGTQTAVSVGGLVPLERGGPMNLGLRGSIRLELAQPLLKSVPFGGVANIDLVLSGSPRAPRVSGTASIEEAYAEWGRLRLDDFRAEVEAQGGTAELRELRGNFLGGSFEMEGELPLPRPDSSRRAKLGFRISDFDLGRWTEASVEGTVRPELVVSASGEIEAEAFDRTAIRGEGRIQHLRAGLGVSQALTAREAVWHIERGILTLPSLALEGGETRLDADVVARFSEAAPSWEATLRGTIDIALLNPLLEPLGGMLVSGKTAIDLKQTGTAQGVLYQGHASLDGARVVIREPPLNLSDLSGEVDFNGTTLTLSDLDGAVGGGRFSGDGTIELEGVRTIRRVELHATADRVRLNYPEGLRTESSGTFTFTGGDRRYRLSGDVRIERGLFDKHLSVRTEILSALGREAGSRLAAEKRFEELVDLDLRVRTEGDIRIANNLAKIDAATTLHITGSLATPEVSGVVTSTGGGTFRLGRNTYLLESGRLLLSGYPLEPPEIDVRARTTVSNVMILFEAKGKLDDLATELRAPDNPEYTRADLASLLVTGRPLERTDSEGSRALGELTGGEILGEQLVSLLGGTLADLAERGLGEALPFDQVSIAPVLVAGEEDPGARFSISKSITPEMMLTYSVGLNDTEGQLWIVDYNLPRRLTFRGIRKDNNEFVASLSQRLPLDLYRRSRPPDPDQRKAPRVSVVDITGEVPLSEAELRDAVKVHPGGRYDYWKLQEDAERLREMLARRGHLNAVVDVDGQEYEGQGARVSFKVVAGPLVRVVWQGNDPGRRVKSVVHKAWDGRVPEEILLLELSGLAARELKRQRYYVASVSAEAAAVEGARRVAFHVTKGPRGDRVVVDFVGNQAVSDLELQKALPSTSSADFFELISERPLRLRESIRLFYASRGYLDARVPDRVTADYDPTSKTLRVRVPIEEGPVARVKAVRLEGVRSLSIETLRKAMQLKEGEAFLLPQYVHDRAAIAALYRREGFTEARVQAAVEPSARAQGERSESRSERSRQPNGRRGWGPDDEWQRRGAPRLIEELAADGVDVVFRVEEGPRAIVGNVQIEGLHATDESVVRRELKFKPGDPLQTTSLAETQRQLYDLGIFRTAEVLARPAGPRTTARDVVIEVAESSDLDISYGLRYDTETGLEGLLDLRVPNLFGRAHHAGLTVLANPGESVFRTSFHAPYLLSHRLDTDVFVGSSVEDEETFVTRSLTFTFQQARYITKKLRLQWSYNLIRSQVVAKTQTGPFVFDVTTYRAPLTASVIEDKRDNLLNPVRGRFWSVTFQLAPKILGSDLRYVKLFGQFFLYYPLGRKMVWASGYRLGVADGFGQFLLESDRFKAGGASSVRGFAQNSLGPVDPITGTIIGGESVAVFNQELRFPIYGWLSGVGFLDAGNVWAGASDLDVLDLRSSAGVGLRLSFPFGLIRFDWARILNPRPGEQTSRYFFSIGHAF